MNRDVAIGAVQNSQRCMRAVNTRHVRFEVLVLVAILIVGGVPERSVAWIGDIELGQLIRNKQFAVFEVVGKLKTETDALIEDSDAQGKLSIAVSDGETLLVMMVSDDTALAPGLLPEQIRRVGFTWYDRQCIAEVRRVCEGKSEAAVVDDRYTLITCLLYTSPSPRDATLSRMPSSA